MSVVVLDAPWLSPIRISARLPPALTLVAARHAEGRAPVAWIGTRPPPVGRVGEDVKLLILPLSGVDHLDEGDLVRRGIELVRCQGHARAVAEHAIALLCDAAKGLSRFDRLVRTTRRWPPATSLTARTRSLESAAVAVVGHGPIGRQVAELARALGMRSVSFRLHPRGPDQRAYADLGPTASEFAFVVLCCPATSITRGLVDRRVLEGLPTDAVVVNVARAEIVDRAALEDALAKRPGMVFAFDVWSTLAPGSPPGEPPAWALDNDAVIVSPYRSWNNPEAILAVEDEVVAALGRHLGEGVLAR